IRRRSVENIISELKKAINGNQEIEYVNFQDDCFLACNSQYLKNFCEIYSEEIGKPFIIRSIPVYITDDKIKTLKSAGISWISIGLQSGSDRVNQDVYQRKSLKGDFLKAANIIKDFNIAAFYDVILDNPFENEEDKLETIKVLMETPKPFYTQFFSLSLFLGTGLYDKASRECPEKIEDSFKKDYLLYDKNALNDMIRISTFIDKKHMEKIMRLYQENAAGLKFKFVLSLVKFLSYIILEPFTYFRTIKLSQRGSYIKTLEVLPNYFFEGIKRYLLPFKS
ncbi:MAG: radical SAM protein, partial [bacterium]